MVNVAGMVCVSATKDLKGQIVPKNLKYCLMVIKELFQ